MKVHIACAAAALLVMTASAGAASFCNCCGASTAQACAAACATVKPPEGQCQAAVDYAAKPEVGAGVNPLYGLSLRNMAVGTPTRPHLEALRRLLEKSRRAAERDRNAAWRQLEKGKIDRAAVSDSDKRYDAAIVNYFLGLAAFRKAEAGK